MEVKPLQRKDKNVLRITERILRRISGPVKESGMWRSKYNRGLYKLYNGPHMVKEIKVVQLRWMGHLFRNQEQYHYRTFIVRKPEGTRRIGRPAIRWLGSVVYLKPVGLRSLRRKSQDRDQWSAIVKRPMFIMDCSPWKRRWKSVSRSRHKIQLLLPCVHEYGFHSFPQSLQENTSSQISWQVFSSIFLLYIAHYHPAIWQAASINEL
jgi:hypothetical protein